MKRIIAFATSLALIFLIISCSKCDCSTDPIDKNLSRVLDMNGEPVVGAKIAINYGLNMYDTTGVYIGSVPPSTYSNLLSEVAGSINLSDSSNIKVWVQEYYSKELIKVLYEGMDDFVWFAWNKKNIDDKYVLNGVYECAFKNLDTGQSDSFIIPLYHSYENVTESEIEFIAQTDANGYFITPEIVVPDYESATHDSLGNISGYYRFSEYFKIWAVKDGLDNFYIDSVTVDDLAVEIMP